MLVWIKNSGAASTGRYISSGNEGNPRKLSLDSKLDFTSNLSSENTLKGKYVPDADKWAYRPDNRGKYVHIHIPYNGTYGSNLLICKHYITFSGWNDLTSGGYGPFKNPYEHDGRAYEHDER